MKIIRKGMYLLLLSLFLILNSCTNSDEIEQPIRNIYTEQEIHDLFSESVFKVEILDKNFNVISQGSGFFVSEKGTFVTNAHVVEDGWYGRIDQDQYFFDVNIVEIIKYNEKYDYAILKAYNLFDVDKYKPVSLSEDYNIGDDVYSIGYPQGSYSSIISKGKILGEAEFDEIPYIVTSAEIDSGSSGGVTVNNKGEVIGITSVGFNDGTFGTIPTRIFKYDINSSNLFPISIKDFFHPSRLVSIDYSNLTTYFDIFVENTDIEYYGTVGVSVYYDIYITSKQEYEFLLSGISLTVQIKTNYRTIFLNGTYSQTDYIYYDVSLESNDVYILSVSTTISGNIYNVDTYSWDIYGVLGSIIIYDWENTEFENKFQHKMNLIKYLLSCKSGVQNTCKII